MLNRIPSLALNPPRFSCDGTLIEMAVHMAAVLLCGQNPILEPLRNLAFDPSSMQVRGVGLSGAFLDLRTWGSHAVCTCIRWLYTAAVSPKI